MLDEATIHTMLPYTDQGRTRMFYTERLGLREGPAPMPGIIVYTAQNGPLYLYPRDTVTPAEHTVASLIVPDVEAAVDHLRKRGVTFEEYDLPSLKTEDGIARHEGHTTAWFRDPAGHIWALIEPDVPDAPGPGTP